MCRLHLAPCLPFHWTSTMTCLLSTEEDELTNQTQTLPSRSFHLAGEEAVTHEGSEGKAFLEFRGGLSVCLHENGFRSER